MSTASRHHSEDVDIADFLGSQRKVIDDHLGLFLPAAEEAPPIIHEAMRYGVLNGGKRLRPVLAIAVGTALGVRFERLIHLACALEMIHAFSLIHDDLPAMDNDDYRRGQPTVHKRYGEAIAILAGDALLSLAFQTLSAMPSEDHAEGCKQIEVLQLIARSAGSSGGMIGGQVADITTEGQDFDREQLESIHRAKTGALITASVEGAAILSSCSGAEVSRIRDFGRRIGLAFQVVDDILDVEGSTAELGKTSGKDQAVRKATYPALYGLEESRRMVRVLIESACDDVSFLGSRANILNELARFISIRRF